MMNVVKRTKFKRAVLHIGLNVINALSAYLLGLTLWFLLGLSPFVLSQLFAYWGLPRFIIHGNPASGYRVFGFHTPYSHFLLLGLSLALFLPIQAFTEIRFKKIIGIIFLLMGIGTVAIVVYAVFTSSYA